MVESYTTSTENPHAEAPAGVLGTLGINGWQFGAQLLHFMIILLIMWRWVYRPLLKTMDERSAKIADGLAFAKTAEAHMAEALHEKDRLVREAQLEARRFMEEAQAKADALRQEKLMQTKKEIEAIVAETKEQITHEREEAFRVLRGDIASLVTLATEKVIQRLGDAERHALVTQAIQEVDQERV